MCHSSMINLCEEKKKENKWWRRKKTDAKKGKRGKQKAKKNMTKQYCISQEHHYPEQSATQWPTFRQDGSWDINDLKPGIAAWSAV